MSPPKLSAQLSTHLPPTPSKVAQARPTIALGNAESPKKTIDLVSQANASELVNTLPGLGGALDTSAAREDRAIQNSLPKLEAEIDGQTNIPEPKPVKVTLGEPKGISDPKDPNQAKKAAGDINRDASNQAKKQLDELKKSSKDVKLQAIDMKGQEQLQANLGRQNRCGY